MKLIAPLYYKKFHCIADACPVSCCVGWRISVDDDSRARYLNERGIYSEELRLSLLYDEEGCYFKSDPQGRCVHLDEKGLCKIHINLGEDYLSLICREHPRFYGRVGDTLRVGIGASCPVAAELILSGEPSYMTEVIGDKDETIPEAYPTKNIETKLSELISNSEDFDTLTENYLSAIGQGSRRIDIKDYFPLFSELEYLREENREIILSALGRKYPTDISSARSILSYFLYRHLPDAESEVDAVAIAIFSLLSTLIVLAIGEETGTVSALQKYSEEIEYSTENKDLIISEISFDLL